MNLSKGSSAPDFALFDTEKKKICLTDFKGKNVLLLFFPQAFTGVCTKELCGVRDDIARYSNAHAQVLGISVDSELTLGKFKEDHNLNFPLLSDSNKEVSAAYGALYETSTFNLIRVSKRSAFVIDKEGVIQYAEVLENAGELPDFQAISEILSSLS